MTFANIVVIIQMATLATLSILFFKAGQAPLALAQLCYLVATAALFLGQA